MSDEMNYQQQVLSEIVAVLGTGPDVTISEIESGLGALYAQHSDEWAQTLIVDTWAKVQLVAQTASNAITMAGAAREVAATLQKQRDAAVQAHTDLLDAVRTVDTGHPLVGDMVEMLTEDIYMDVMNDGGYHSFDPGMDVTEVAQIPVTTEEAGIFHACLTDERLMELPDAQADELRAILAKFISGYVKMVKKAEQAAAKAGAA